MPVTVELSVSESVEVEDPEIPDIDSLQSWAQSACLDDDDVVASLQIVSRNEMQELNNTYRGKDWPTNVLSFPMQLPEEVELNLLGDIALCADIIISEAAVLGISMQAHWAHMVVHGMLHLQGYDHIEETEAEAMESMEINVLKKLGFDNPYVQN